MATADSPSCCGTAHFSRRTLLRAAGASGLSWLTPVAEALARADAASPRGKPPRSLILLWMAGGPSQLETFDPKPGTSIAAGTLARPTCVPGIQVARGMEQIADKMHQIALVRSVVSKEGDHERATYAVKTGYRPDPTLIHPSLGAIVCHQLPDAVEIPRHVSILPGQWPARGGYLGAAFDAFQVHDPQKPIPDVTAQVNESRLLRRVADLEMLDQEFARGRLMRGQSGQADTSRQSTTTQAALRMMSSEQLQAFDIMRAPFAERAAFGPTPFGRACLAAGRLIEAGVRCVEVTLGGWDSHVNNHEIQQARVEELDPAFAALLTYLEQRSLLDTTLILWGGEFGRTPHLNPVAGRDHWPHGFTIALAGGGIVGGQVIGETSRTPPVDGKNWSEHLRDPRPIEDIHATVLRALGIRSDLEIVTPIGRPMKLCEGTPIRELLRQV